MLWAILWGSVPTSLAWPAPPETAPAAVPSLRSGLAQLRRGESAAAAKELQAFLASEPSPSERKSAQIALGQSRLALQEYAAAQQAFEGALELASQPSEATVLRLAAADAAVRGEQAEDALAHCRQILDGEPAPNHRVLAVRTALRAHLELHDYPQAVTLLDQQTPRLVEADAELQPLGPLVLQLGTRCLKSEQASTALQLYQWHRESLPEDEDRQVAELGSAWAAALGAEAAQQAALRMAQFLKTFPESPDAAAVLQAEAACWERAGDSARATERFHQLIIDHPQTVAARRAVIRLSSPEQDDTSEPIVAARRRLVLESDPTEPAAPFALAAALRDAAVQADPQVWQTLLAQTLTHPETAAILRDGLQRLLQAQQDASAERLAARVLSQLDAPASRPAVDAVARWAADSGRWSMLALASEAHDPTALVPQLTADSSRLIAEALIQSGQNRQAKAWYDAAVDAHQLNDFAALLRRTELSVAFDPIAIAKQHLAAAETSARRPADEAIIQILTAELLIRQAKLNESRAMLQRIVRWEEANPEVRCRAQWLIGETFLMQKQYRNAIDAYRRVEAMEASQQWVPAALVQAGRAFEKLGRSREASMCYSGLLQRFADSEHALVARDRLASMRDATTLR
jgi:TolA-binding protein